MELNNQGLQPIDQNCYKQQSKLNEVDLMIDQNDPLECKIHQFLDQIPINRLESSQLDLKSHYFEQKRKLSGLYSSNTLISPKLNSLFMKRKQSKNQTLSSSYPPSYSCELQQNNPQISLDFTGKPKRISVQAQEFDIDEQQNVTSLQIFDFKLEGKSPGQLSPISQNQDKSAQNPTNNDSEGQFNCLTTKITNYADSLEDEHLIISLSNTSTLGSYNFIENQGYRIQNEFLIDKSFNMVQQIINGI